MFFPTRKSPAGGAMRPARHTGCRARAPPPASHSCRGPARLQRPRLLLERVVGLEHRRDARRRRVPAPRRHEGVGGRRWHRVHVALLESAARPSSSGRHTAVTPLLHSTVTRGRGPASVTHSAVTRRAPGRCPPRGAVTCRYVPLRVALLEDALLEQPLAQPRLGNLRLAQLVAQCGPPLVDVVRPPEKLRRRDRRNGAT